MKSAWLKSRWNTAVATIALLALFGVPAIADELAVNSEDGDIVGSGNVFNYTDVTGAFTVSRNASNGITIDYLGLDATVAAVELAGPALAALAVGSYPDAVKHQDGVSLPQPGLRVQPGTGIECTELSGSFEVLEVTYLPDNSVDTLAVNIEQFCETSLRKLTAEIRINSTVPVGPTGLVADAGIDQIVSPGVLVTLDGSGSLATDAAPFTYAWQQLSGVTVTLDDASLQMPSFTAPLTTNREYEILHFELRISDAALRESIDEVIVVVSESLVQTTVYRIDTQGFLGFTFDNTITDIPANLFSFTRLADNGIGLDLTEDVGGGGETDSRLEMSAPGGATLAVGNYEYALHNNSKPDGWPGLSLVYDGNDAPASLGRFDVLEVAYLDNGAIDRLAINYRLADTNPAETVMGYLRYNSVVPLSSRVPITSAGHDRIFHSDEPVAQLDGSGTIDQNPGTLVYNWTQTAGPAVTLTGFDTATPTFAPPQGLAAGAGMFAFELTTTNENGFSDTDSVDVQVLGDNDPKTFMYFRGALANGGVTPLVTVEALVKPDENDITLLELDSGNSAFDNGVQLDAQGRVDYSVIIGEVAGLLLAPGTYADTGTATSAFSPLLQSMTAGASCGAGGAFRLHEIQRNAGSGEIESLAVDFFQNCPVERTYGVLRFNSLVPFDVTQPTSVAGNDFVAIPGQTITLDGNFSWDVDGTIDSFQWVQTAGPTQVITDADMSTATVTLPPGLVVAAPLEFELTVTDDDGNVHSDTVLVSVIPLGTPLSGMLLSGDEGDSGFSGADQYFLAPVSNFSILTDNPDQIVVEAGPFELDLVARTAAVLIEDNYENALSVDSALGLFPGLLLRNLPACVFPSGRFVILELVRDGLGDIQTLAVDFEMDCSDDDTRFYGALRFNSAIPFRNTTPNAAAGDDIIASEDEVIILDGSNSRDPDNPAVGSLTGTWTQTLGAAVTLTPLDNERASFVVPAASAGTSFEFQYAVTDLNANTDSDLVTVEVRQFRTRAIVLREPINEPDELVDLSENRMTNAVTRVGLVDSFDFNGKDEYRFELQSNDTPNLVPGVYPIDNRLIPDANTIRFIISGPAGDYQQAFTCEANNDFGENEPDGWVEVREVNYDAGNVVDRISFDFQVFCNNNAFWGSVQLDSDLFRAISIPIASAGNTRFVTAGSNVTLSAIDTTIPPGQTVTYRWRQLSGEPGVIEDSTAAVTTLRIPTVGESHNPVMTIELLVVGSGGFLDRDLVELFLVVPEAEARDAVADENNTVSGSGSSGASSITVSLLLLMGILQLAAIHRRKISAMRNH